ncbi:hypothetical protein BKA69DRAFT_137465 [Paraphysoderma sedebokerense]|nr:hypothetical protein BKA69DRAFT_137465 [Paraphysoderma sedebokerense]
MPGPEAVVYSDSPLAEYLHEISADDQFVKEPRASNNGRTGYFSVLVEKIKELPTQLSSLMVEIFHSRDEEPSEIRKLQEETYRILHDHRRHFNPSPRNYLDKSILLFITMASATFIFLKPNLAPRFFLDRNLRPPKWLLGSLAVPTFWVLKRSVMEIGSFDRQRKCFLVALDQYSLLSATLCASFNKSIRRVQEIELISRGYRYSNPMPPISRIDRHSSANKQCAHLRRQLSSSVEEIVTSYMNNLQKIAKCSSLQFQNELDEVVQFSVEEVLAIGNQRLQDIADSLEQLKHGVHVVRALMDIFADSIYNVTKSVTEAYERNLAFLTSCIDGLSEKLEIAIHDIQRAEEYEFGVISHRN